MLPNNSPRNLIQRNERFPHKEHLKMYVAAIFIIAKKKTQKQSKCPPMMNPQSNYVISTQ